MKSAVLNAHLGKTIPVLWEGKGHAGETGDTVYSGYTPNYLRVEAMVPDGVALSNEIKYARLESLSVDGNSAIAKPL